MEGTVNINEIKAILFSKEYMQWLIDHTSNTVTAGALLKAGFDLLDELEGRK